jgi:predicted nucleic acid-binding protein
MPVLANATIISNFAAAERLDILRALWQTICSPVSDLSSVLNEE